MHKERSGRGYPVQAIRDFHRQLQIEIELALADYGARPHTNIRALEDELWELRERYGHATMLPLYWIRGDTTAETEEAIRRHQEFQCELLGLFKQAIDLLTSFYEDVYECVDKAPYGTIHQVWARDIPRVFRPRRR